MSFVRRGGWDWRCTARQCWCWVLVQRWACTWPPRSASGLTFLLLLLPALAALILAPPLLYRLIALQRATYVLRRDGILLSWGLRREEIPMDQVQWVGPPEALGSPVPHALGGWPGAVLSTRSLADGRTAGIPGLTAGMAWC